MKTSNDSASQPDDRLTQTFHELGHVTLPDVFTKDEIAAAAHEIECWSKDVIASMPINERNWYLEAGADQPQLRKLDQPVYHRLLFRRMAEHPALCRWARRLTGADALVVCFSQIFMKPPEVGGPKPVHQDNFYFGPDRDDAMLTAWIAIDDATEANGCLYYGRGSHRGGILPHEAPAAEPFNLQVNPTEVASVVFEAAPVSSGGVSLHHGNTLHRSSANTSQLPRRALAIHYLDETARLARPALKYDESLYVAIG